MIDEDNLEVEFDGTLDYEWQEGGDSFSIYRLLMVDNPLVLPVHEYIRLLISSSDVIHSFAVPSFGIKMDACPGRLNSVICYLNRVGHFYGQCSELCGIFHGFMPISILAVPLETYLH